MAKGAHSCCILRNTLNSVQDNVTRVLVYTEAQHMIQINEEKKKRLFFFVLPLSKNSVWNRER